MMLFVIAPRVSFLTCMTSSGVYLMQFFHFSSKGLWIGPWICHYLNSEEAKLWIFQYNELSVFCQLLKIMTTMMMAMTIVTMNREDWERGKQMSISLFASSTSFFPCAFDTCDHCQASDE